MVRLRTYLFFVLAAAGAACSQDLTEQIPDAAPPADAGPCQGTTTVFLNTEGGVYYPGDPANPSLNVTSIVGEETAVAPSGLPPATLDEVLQCSRDLIAPYNIEIVTSDPGGVPHHEIVMTATNSDALGIGANVGWISGFDCAEFFNLAFVFTNVGNVGEYCQGVVRAIMFAANIDQLFDCQMVGSLLIPCGDRGIYDQAVECGEFEARACSCGGSKINPHQQMLEHFGPACSQ